MKKIIKGIFIILIMIVTFSLIACKEDEEEENKPNDPIPVEVDPIGEDPKEEDPKEEENKETKEALEKAIEYINSHFNNLEVNKDINLPNSISEFNASLEWVYNSKYLKDGKFTPPSKDEVLEVVCKVTINGEVKEANLKFLLKKKVEEDHSDSFKKVEEYLLGNFDGIEVNGDIEFPTYLEEYKAELIWESGEDEYLSNEGKFKAPILDLEDDIFVTVIIGGKEKEVDLCLTLKGWGTVMDVIKDWIKKQVPSTLSTSIRLPQTHNHYRSQITWTSSDTDHLTNEGYITKDPNKDKVITLNCHIVYGEEESDMVLYTIVLKLSDKEKNAEVKDWLDGMFSGEIEINGDIDLPKTDLKYGAVITWKSNSPGIISESGKYNTPISDRVVSLVATSKLGDSTISMTYSFETYGKPITDVWEGVSKILSYIALEHITNFTYITYGGQEGYKQNVVQEYGYLLFYTEEKSVITDRMLDYTYGHCRTGIKKTSTQYIVVHDTWNTAPSADALAHANYLKNVNDNPNGDYVSWHFVIDENYAVQQLPLDEVAYHAGDGSHVYGDTYYNDYYKYQAIGGGNRNGIGIETCVNYGCNYTNVMRRCAKLVAELLIDYNLGLERVKQHHDFSGKNCPCVMRENHRWEEFLNMVEIFYYGKTVLKDVTFKWTSLSPDILDNEGHIINHPREETIVKYKVDVTYQGETRTFEFSSIVDSLK